MIVAERRWLSVGMGIFLLAPFSWSSETNVEEKAVAPADAEPKVVSPGSKSPEQAEPKTNSVSPAFVGVALSVGTAAWILSDVDWGDDKAEPPDDTLPAPATIAPEGTILVDTGTVVFRWKAVKGAAGYLVDVNLCAEGSICSDFRLERVSGTEWAVEWPAGVTAGRWRVRAIDAQNYAGRWSELVEFRIQAAAP